MNENINLCEILKGYQEGAKFWSPIYGELSLFDISEGTKFPIRFKDKDGIVVSFMSNGFRYEYNAECLVFPDKNHRDWSKWKCHKPKFDPKTLQPFDKVLFKNDSNKWNGSIISHVEDIRIYLMTGGYVWYCIPYNDETKHLVGTTDEAPEYYRYWED